MNEITKELRGTIKLNKYIIIFLFVFFLFSVGASYAYFAYQVENTSVIAGNIISIDADLTVELVVGSNEEMVPLQDEALSNAINGVGSTNGACVDSMGNLSCQVYKITLTNNGSRLKNLTGTVELYAKSGTGNVYNNLKWQELSNTTTVKEGSTPNGMKKSNLVTGLTVESKEVKTWYIAVWISNINSDQRDTDKGDFEGRVTFSLGDKAIYDTLTKNAVADNISSTYVSNTNGIQFSSISSDTNGKGIYLLSSTANNDNPIYYYRGAVDNNNLIFAGYCWKIVRTTDTGGIKILYNGTPTDGTCDNTGTASQIGTKAFNSSSHSPAWVGYMYGTVYGRTTKTMTDITDTYYYGNDISYDETTGKYTLTGGTITSNAWSSIYESSLNNYHYTCFSTTETCDNVNGEVYYIYHTTDTTAFYITLTGGKTVENALSEMLDYNTTNSTIKGNNTTEGTLDYWYYTNIQQTGYSNYIEDTVWCNDRTIYDLNGWDPDGGVTYNTSWAEYSLLFGPYGRAAVTRQPSLTCERDIDKFTVSTSNGNGDLDYPVGLLTADEIMLAGGRSGSDNTTYYLNTEQNWWAGSPPSHLA